MSTKLGGKKQVCSVGGKTGAVGIFRLNLEQCVPAHGVIYLCSRPVRPTALHLTRNPDPLDAQLGAPIAVWENHSPSFDQAMPRTAKTGEDRNSKDVFLGCRELTPPPPELKLAWAYR